MSIVLYNPHIDDFLAAPPHYGILKRRPLKKYGFFITESLKDTGCIEVVVDATMSAFVPEQIFPRLPRLLRLLVANFEFARWKKINGFSEDQVRRLPATSTRGRNFLTFSYKAATGGFRLREKLLQRQNSVVFHLSHYFIYSRQKAANIRRLSNAYVAGDSDIRENSYFMNFFGWYEKPFLILPFAVGSRFEVRKTYAERLPLCVATGSFHDLTRESGPARYVDYLDFAKRTSYHPVREAIYVNREALTGQIRCQVSPYRDYAEKKSRLGTLLSHLRVSQKKYFSVDIVGLYNGYRMAVVGEEWIGFPALGAFEAMACGCTLIANPLCYKGLHMREFEHFVPYDGSLEGLLRAIQEAEGSDYEAIAKKGADLVAREFSPTAAYARWKAVLKELEKAS